MSRVLLIEDEPAIADAAVYALATDGFEVQWCATGAEGLAAFRADPPTLVILDIGLPDANGFELFRSLRGESSTAPPPVIFLTARSEEIDRVAGLEMGADDYVSKPFSPRELSARVRAVLRRSQQTQAAPTPPATPFEIDESRLEIRYNGVLLELSRYEFRLLKLLAQHPGRVYTREQLMQQVWNNPEHSLDRTVDTHIKTLRAKLRAVSGTHNPIKTHRGIGYSLEIRKSRPSE